MAEYRSKAKVWGEPDKRGLSQVLYSPGDVIDEAEARRQGLLEPQQAPPPPEPVAVEVTPEVQTEKVPAPRRTAAKKAIKPKPKSKE